MSAASAPTLLSPTGHARLVAVGHWCAAVLFSALTAGVVFLVMVEGSQHKGFTDVTFNHSLGVLIGGTATEARTDAALGVSGDTAAPTGLAWFTLIVIAVMIAYGLTIHRWVKRPWYVMAIPLGAAVFLLVSLVYMPLVGRNIEGSSVGAFGVGGGGITTIVYLISSFGFALVAARVFTLATRPEWWVPRQHDAEEALRHIDTSTAPADFDELMPDERSPRPSLELAKERAEDGDVGPRG